MSGETMTMQKIPNIKNWAQKLVKEQAQAKEPEKLAGFDAAKAEAIHHIRLNMREAMLMSSFGDKEAAKQLLREEIAPCVAIAGGINDAKIDAKCLSALASELVGKNDHHPAAQSREGLNFAAASLLAELCSDRFDKPQERVCTPIRVEYRWSPYISG